jgi:DNA-binding NarL/FixJ family response regulator
MSAQQPAQILLADDHETVRRGLRAMIESRREWQICAETADGRTAVQLAQELKPQLVIMDVRMPELNGIEATRQIVRTTRSPVLMLTMHESEQFIHEALAAGARGYILKSDAGREMLAAVEAVLNGLTFFTTPMAARIYEAEFHDPRLRASARRRSTLTPREREILQLLAEGRKNREVAAALKITVKTAETHRSRIMTKLKLETVAELVRYAIRNGVIAP